MAGSDGLRPPGAETGVPRQADAAGLFNAVIAAFKALLIVTHCSGATVQTACWYVQPPHLPKRPKLVQSPLLPTLMDSYLIPPFLTRSLNNIVG